VLSASEQMAFRPNHIAHQLRTRHSTTLGVRLPSLLNPVFALQLQTMEQQARLAGDGTGRSHQVALDLHPEGPAHFILEPSGFLLHCWQPLQGMLTHQCAIGHFSGPWPFYTSQGLID